MEQFLIERSVVGKDNAYLMDELFGHELAAIRRAELLLGVGLPNICYTVLRVKDRVIDIEPVAVFRNDKCTSE